MLRAFAVIRRLPDIQDRRNQLFCLYACHGCGSCHRLEVLRLDLYACSRLRCAKPVVDPSLRLADTERYMSTPQLNPVGYRNSSVHDMEGFKHLKFALAHGTGDDNGAHEFPLIVSFLFADILHHSPVHFLNSAALLDRLTSAQVRYAPPSFSHLCRTC